MKVRQGWSGEVAPNKWAKFDVDLGEDDLFRMMLTAGIEVEDSTEVPVLIAFRLLEAEAERLVLAKLMTAYGYPQETGRARIAALDESKADTLRALKSHLQDVVEPKRQARLDELKAKLQAGV